MPISVDWFNAQKTVIRLHYTKPWDWAEFEHAVTASNAMMDTVDYSISMIIQMDGGLPSNVNASRFRMIFRNFHRNIRVTALIGASDFLRVTITAFMRVIRQDKDFFFAATVDDALKGFEQRYPTASAEKTI